MIEPPPDPNTSHPSETALLARMLFDAQSRLRADVEELRRNQHADKGENKESKDEGKEEDKPKDEKESKPEPKAPMKERVGSWVREHPRSFILIVAGFVVLVAAAILIWRYLESYENTDDAFVDGHTDPISARISGFITKVYVENTYHVKRGELIVEIDPRPYLIAKEQAGAALAQAEAAVGAQTPNVPITATAQNTQVINARLDVAAATANLTAAQAKYQSAVADLHQAEAGQANAGREEARYKQLVAKQEVSAEQYDQRATEAKMQTEMVAARRQSAEAAVKAVAQAEAQLQQAKQQAQEEEMNSPRQISVQNHTLDMRVAELKTAQARGDDAQLNLEYTRIYAPADGIIGDRSVQVGMQVQPGQELLALTETNNIWVTANFKETQVRRMRAGQPVTIHVDALKQDFDGYVEALPGASGAVYSLLPPENATGNYVKVVQRLPVRIRFRSNAPGLDRLAPGMSVEPKVWLK